MFAGSKSGQPGAAPRGGRLARPDHQPSCSVHPATTAAVTASTAATKAPLLLVVGRVAGNSAPSGRGLHQVLVRTSSILVEETVERLLVDPCLGELNLER